LKPIKFKKSDDGNILIKWDDEREFSLSLQYLRDRCPCASCAGESILWHEYKPSPLQVLTPGKYDLKSAEVVGNYAFALMWGDGHSTGIYAFDYLRRICVEYNKDSSSTGQGKTEQKQV
jgi:DUF971 family protein